MAAQWLEMKLFPSTRLRMNPCPGLRLRHAVWVLVPHLPVFAHQDLGLGATPIQLLALPFLVPERGWWLTTCIHDSIQWGKELLSIKMFCWWLLTSKYNGIFRYLCCILAEVGCEIFGLFSVTLSFCTAKLQSNKKPILHKWHCLDFGPRFVDSSKIFAFCWSGA